MKLTCAVQDKLDFASFIWCFENNKFIIRNIGFRILKGRSEVVRVGHYGNRGCRSGHHGNRGSRSWQQWRAIAITILPSLNCHFSCTHCAVNCHTTQPIFTCLQHNIIIITQLIIQTQHVVGTNETSFNLNYIFQLSKKLFLQQHHISNNLFGRRP